MFSARWFFSHVAALALLLVVPSSVVRAADPPGWVGTYFTKKHLNGKAYFQLGIQRSGKSLLIAFNAAYHDGHDVAPEAQGTAESKDLSSFRAAMASQRLQQGKFRGPSTPLRFAQDDN